MGDTLSLKTAFHKVSKFPIYTLDVNVPVGRLDAMNVLCLDTWILPREAPVVLSVPHFPFSVKRTLKQTFWI